MHNYPKLEKWLDCLYPPDGTLDGVIRDNTDTEGLYSGYTDSSLQDVVENFLPQWLAGQIKGSLAVYNRMIRTVVENFSEAMIFLEGQITDTERETLQAHAPALWKFIQRTDYLQRAQPSITQSMADFVEDYMHLWEEIEKLQEYDMALFNDICERHTENDERVYTRHVVKMADGNLVFELTYCLEHDDMDTTLARTYASPDWTEKRIIEKFNEAVLNSDWPALGTNN